MMKNKIYIDMNGRLGNQFFQYAFARLFMISNNYECIIDFWNVERRGKELNSTKSFVDCLKYFNVVPYHTINETGFCVKKYGSLKQKMLLHFYYFFRKVNRFFPKSYLLRKYQYIMQKNGIYKEDECNIFFFKKYKQSLFIRGYFENPTLFLPIRDTLLNELSPKFPRLTKNAKLYSIIDNCESVCVSIRYWDEIQDDLTLLKSREVCTKDYYYKAIDKMRILHPKSVFIIFSNDINHVKKNYHFPCKVYFENGDDPIYEKLRLMYSCKHFIISTSTFSWWAQYLSQNVNKTVISPNKWYADAQKTYLIDEKWIKIPV